MILISSCEKKSIKQEEAESEQNQKKLNNTIALTADIKKGRKVYFANCVSCHNHNPKKPGSIGPEVYGVSIDVLTQKIVSGKYPENYRPKRRYARTQSRIIFLKIQKSNPQNLNPKHNP